MILVAYKYIQKKAKKVIITIRDVNQKCSAEWLARMQTQIHGIAAINSNGIAISARQ